MAKITMRALMGLDEKKNQKRRNDVHQAVALMAAMQGFVIDPASKREGVVADTVYTMHRFDPKKPVHVVGKPGSPMFNASLVPPNRRPGPQKGPLPTPGCNCGGGIAGCATDCASRAITTPFADNEIIQVTRHFANCACLLQQPYPEHSAEIASEALLRLEKDLPLCTDDVAPTTFVLPAAGPVGLGLPVPPTDVSVLGYELSVSVSTDDPLPDFSVTWAGTVKSPGDTDVAFLYPPLPYSMLENKRATFYNIPFTITRLVEMKRGRSPMGPGALLAPAVFVSSLPAGANVTLRAVGSRDLAVVERIIASG